jgi:hypothetical protein
LSRNSDRLGGPAPSSDPTPLANDQLFNFVVPTEFIDLPSQGRFYPEGHPLHNQDTIELKHMTAKEEDMLTSKTLLKKGVALERVIDSLIIDRRIKAKSLLVGDRNAVIIGMRLHAYGPEYKTTVTCPACRTKGEYAFDISQGNVYHGEEQEGVESNGDGTFTTTLPVFKLSVVFRMLNGYDEDVMSNRRKSGSESYETNVSSILRKMIVSVEGHTDPRAINKLVDNITSKDSRHLRNTYKKVAPNMDLTQYFECGNCGHSGDLEVPLNPEFFWPDK